jgi:hypothetical protein
MIGVAGKSYTLADFPGLIRTMPNYFRIADDPSRTGKVTVYTGAS